MFCSRCGHENPESAAFCTACGNTLIQHSKTTPQPFYNPDSVSKAGYPQPSFSPPQPPNQSAYASPAPYPPQGGYGQMPYTPYAARKKRTGLIAGLLAGALLVAIAAVALFVWPGVLAAKAPDVTGYWYSEDRGEALEFKSNGTIRVLTTYGSFKGKYEYDSAQGLGIITVDDTEYEFAMTEDGLKVNGMGIYEKAQDDFDVDDFLEDMSAG